MINRKALGKGFMALGLTIMLISLICMIFNIEMTLLGFFGTLFIGGFIGGATARYISEKEKKKENG